MLTEQEIADAGRYVEQLRLLVHELEVPANERTRASGGCFSIAQEHHHAIVWLIESKLFAAAFSLVRIEFESYIRGEWLAMCASDAVVEAFLKGKEPPRIDCLIGELEMLDSFASGVLSQIKQKNWKAMCAFTHTGGVHVQRWNTADGIESNYSRDEILEVIRFAEIIASLATVGVARLANNEHRANQILGVFSNRVEKHERQQSAARAHSGE